MELQTKLMTLAKIWVAAHGPAERSVTLETLSSRATSDGKLFKRLRTGSPMYVPTLERVFEYLANVEHWPGDVMPIEAAELLNAPVVKSRVLAG